MSEWILICNSKYFDIKKAFETENMITWPQLDNISIGDVAYFYVSDPYRSVLYKCEVEAIDLHRMDEAAKDFVTHVLFYENKQTYMRLKLIHEYPEGLLTDEEIKKNGLFNLQTSSRASAELLDYITRKTRRQKKKFSIKWIIIIAVAAVIIAIFLVRNWSGSKTHDNSEAVTDIINEEKEESVSSNTDISEETIDSLEISCYTTTLLIGDSINTRLKADNWTLEGESRSIKWNTDNDIIASIDNEGILTANSAGTCNLTAEYGGKTSLQEITVVEVDKNSGASISSDYEQVSMSPYNEDTVVLTLGGAIPEHFGAVSYYSAGVSLILDWGEIDNNSVSLTIEALPSDEKEGYVTILVYDQDNPSHVVASTKISVRIN